MEAKTHKKTPKNFPFRPKDKSLMDWLYGKANERKRSVNNYLETILDDMRKDEERQRTAAA